MPPALFVLSHSGRELGEKKGFSVFTCPHSPIFFFWGGDDNSFVTPHSPQELRIAVSITGSLVDFLKTSEGVKLSINKLLDMAAQVRNSGWSWESSAGLQLLINHCTPVIITDC